MAYKYTPKTHVTHEQLFGRPSDSFPTLELPVPTFSDPDVAARYDGASDWANVLLRIAMTASERRYPAILRDRKEDPVSILLEQSNLWLNVGMTAIGGDSLKGQLSVSATEVRLMASKQDPLCAEELRWDHRAYGNTITHMRTENPSLFTLEDSRDPLAVTQHRYPDEPSNRDYQSDPALRIAHIFGEAAAAIEQSRFSNRPEASTIVSITFLR